MENTSIWLCKGYNFDALVQGQGVELGLVAHNSLGEVLASAIWVSVEDITVAKALGFRWACQMVKYLCFTRLIFESGCLPLLHAWRSKESKLGRECNSLVEILAKLAFVYKECTWMDFNSNFQKLSFFLSPFFFFPWTTTSWFSASFCKCSLSLSL
ncbi:hypothetical protein RJT34_29380 [Clitoria ternatea]|uniref:RNase H type-1 domain-containing protein n=1 Tax=Clitoria ternatea TaxID=43366 RepID=A0AAN9IAW1_CLITE